jgi:hypothetical protein
MLSKDDKFSLKWNEKLKTIANYPLIQTSNLLNIPVEDLDKLNKLLNADIPPAIEIDISTKKYSISKPALKEWAVFTKDYPELENSCMYNGTKIRCSEMLDSPEIYKYIEDMVSLFKESSFQEIANLFFIYVRFEHNIQESFKSEGRRVYIVKSSDFSPQVDFLGNLYIPKNFETLYTQREQDLVMNHEAAHVANFSIDYILALSNDFKKAIKLDSEMSFNRLISISRQTDEMLVDLIAAAEFSMDSKELKLMANILNRLEPTIREREEGLILLGDLTNLSIKPSELLQNKLDLMLHKPNQFTERVNKLKLRTSRARTLAMKYREALIKYTIYRLPSYIVGMTDDYSKVDLITTKAEVERELLLNACTSLNFPDSEGNWLSMNLCTLNLN